MSETVLNSMQPNSAFTAAELMTRERAWLVHAGALDLFLARVHANGTGARHPLCRVSAGQVLFSFGETIPKGWKMLVQFAPDLHVQVLEASQYADWQSDWLMQLSAATGASLPADLDVDIAAITGPLLHSFVETLQLREEKERAHLYKQHEEDLRHVEDAFHRLASTLVPERRHFDFNSDVHDPLFKACEILGRYQGISFTPPVELLRGLPVRDPLAAIARASSVRNRRVILTPDVWQKAEQPFLATRESDGMPLAFLPDGPRGYTVFDPANQATVPVTDDVIHTLTPFGFVFYRPFPPKRLGLRDLLTFGLRGSISDLWMILFCGVLAGMLATATPLLASTIFDVYIPEAESRRLLLACLFLVTAAFSSILCNLARGFAVLRMQGRLEAAVQAAIWDRLLNLPVPFFRRFSAGDLASRGMAISEMRRVLSGAAVSSILTAVFSVFSYALLFYFSVPLALLATVLTALALSVTVFCSVLYIRYQRQILNIRGNIASALLQIVQGIAKFRIAGTEERAFTAWANVFAQQQNMAARTARLSRWMNIFNVSFPLLGAICIFYAMAQQSMANLSTGQFLAFILAYGQFTGAVMQAAMALLPILNIVPLYERAKPILEALPEVDRSKTPSRELAGRVELNQLSFRYTPENPLILNEVSCDIHPGEFVAFVGPSGAGKSTLLRLLLGFEKPEAGAVYFDGQDLQNLDIQSVRQQMGVVLQNATLFSGDIYNNIIGSSPYSMDEAWEAARLAGCDAEIKALPMGMHTVLGEGGAGISGGQRQRIMIARALVGRPRILIFDEATSALDNHTQALVSHSLEQLQVTRIVIAHRLSTIVHADRIFVMDGGRIVQSGTYEELMQQQGLFTTLAQRQVV